MFPCILGLRCCGGERRALSCRWPVFGFQLQRCGGKKCCYGLVQRERDVGGKGRLCVLYDSLGGRTNQDSTNNPLTLQQHIAPPHLFPTVSPHHFIPTCLHFFPVFSRRYCNDIMPSPSKNPHRRLDVHAHNK